MKYRKNTVVVEAEQYRHPSEQPVGVLFDLDGQPYVVIIHQQRVYIEPGDWILPRPDGIHYYPVKPDIFEATYEPAEEKS